MHKQDRKHKGNRKNWRDANSRISGECSEFIVSITDRFDETGDFSVNYLRDSFLSKFCDEKIVSAAARKRAAIDKWLSTEGSNRISNDRIRGRDRGYNILPRVSFYKFLSHAQRLVSSVLGPLDDSIVVGSFSGGASTSRQRTHSHPAMKYTGEAHLTRECWEILDVLHREIPMFKHHGIFLTSLTEVRGAVLFTVPKKTDIDRCACKEPDINMFLQKGVGKHIRHRLSKFGINLNDQRVNRRLARVGSVDDSISTLDLSSASDTMTIKLVQALLPSDWFEYLNCIRSQEVEVDGTWVRTEMFSSMGNGFTFELESLLFWVLMKTTAYLRGYSGIISVYGDDIIIPSGMYDDAVWILNEFGFTVNLDKSFHLGSFRESCGGHYHNGEDVTPFYLKRRPTHLTDVIRVANQLRRWAFADPVRQYAHPWIFQVWKTLRSFVPEDLWGGYDLDIDTQLASPDSPRNRLTRVSKEKGLNELGRYALWHNSFWNRSMNPEEVGFAALDTSPKRCRRRRSTPGAPRIVHEFYEELVLIPDPG